MTKQKLFKKTNKDFIASLPRFLYDGPIEIIDQKDAAETTVQKLLQAGGILGFDTETRPSFKRGERHKVALLQIADKEKCYLFRLSKTGLTDGLTALLSNPEILKIGLSLRDDLSALRKRRDFEPKNCLDLQNLVRRLGIEDMSLQKLYANVFGQRISKKTRLTNWEAPELTENQQRYAATDAVACIRLYERLMALSASGNYELLIPDDETQQTPSTVQAASEKNDKTNH